MEDPVYLSQFLSDLIYLRRVFQRADGKSGGKIVKIPFTGKFRRFLHSHPVTAEAPLPAFRNVLQPLCHAEKLLRLVWAFHYVNGMAEIHLFCHPAQLPGPLHILFPEGYVRVIKKHRDLKVF